MSAVVQHHSFAAKRNRCPKCGSRRGFSQLIGSPGAGKCHACNEFISPSHKEYGTEGLLRKRNGIIIDLMVRSVSRESIPNEDNREVPFDKVLPSLLALVRARARENCTDRPGTPECDAFEELAAKFEYDSGTRRPDAETLAAKELGFIRTDSRTAMLQKIREEVTLLRREHPFLATITELTSATTLSEWHVGVSEGAILLWYVDSDGRFRNAKKIWYDKNGWNRLRDGVHDPHYLYRGRPLPLYGEHQLSRSMKDPIVLVESEKTAIVLSAHLTGFVLLATGGSEALTERRAQSLKGRVVHILFDRDRAGTRGAVRARDMLKKVGGYPAIIDPYALWPSAPDGFDGADAIYHDKVLGIDYGAVRI